jgi:hypothetical protein
VHDDATEITVLCSVGNVAGAVSMRALKLDNEHPRSLVYRLHTRSSSQALFFASKAYRFEVILVRKR